MPLGLQAALALGCVATVAPGARGRPLGEGFDLAELQVGGWVCWSLDLCVWKCVCVCVCVSVCMRMRAPQRPLAAPPLDPPAPAPPPQTPPPSRQYADTTRCGYLEGEGPEGLGPLRYLSLYQSADAGRGRGVLCLLMPATARGLLVVVQPSALPAREVRGRGVPCCGARRRPALRRAAAARCIEARAGCLRRMVAVGLQTMLSHPLPRAAPRRSRPPRSSARGATAWAYSRRRATTRRSRCRRSAAWSGSQSTAGTRSRRRGCCSARCWVSGMAVGAKSGLGHVVEACHC